MELKAFVVCPLIGTIALLLALAKLPVAEKRLLVSGWAAHIVGAFAISYYHEHFGGGDMLNYSIEARPLTRLLQLEIGYYGPEILKLALHMENRLPIQLILEGPGATMCAIAGFLKLFVGDNLYAEAVSISFFVFAGLASLYRSLRLKLEPGERVPTIIALFLIPSAIFWTSGIVKEAMVVGFLGFLAGGLARLGEGRAAPIFVGLVTIGVSALGIAVIKPYTLFPIVLGLGGWFYAKRGAGLSTGYKVLGIAVAIAGLIIISRAFPEFAVDTLGGRIELLQHRFRDANAHVAAGSAIDLGEGEEERGLGGQLVFAPLALLNALARPFLFEANNVPMFIASIEMTVLLVLAISLFRRPGLGMVLRTIRARPPLFFAAIFVLSFGTAIGLATLNLGSLSRYRVPMMPMYAGLLLVLRQRFKVTAPTPDPVGLKHPRPAPVATALAKLAAVPAATRRARVLARRGL